MGQMLSLLCVFFFFCFLFFSYLSLWFLCFACSLPASPASTQPLLDRLSLLCCVTFFQAPASSAASSTQPLLDRLSSFESGLASEQYRLIQFPPDYEAAPCKPVLFDLAFNHIQFPVDSIQKRAQPEKKGFWSLFGR